MELTVTRPTGGRGAHVPANRFPLPADPRDPTSASAANGSGRIGERLRPR